MRLRLLGCIALLMALTTQAALGQQTGLGGWQSADGGQTDASYVGSIDSPAAGASIGPSGSLTVSGWFVDTTAQGWAGADAVQVVQGPMNGGTLLAQGLVGLNRPDVAATLGNSFWAASGWSATLDASRLPAGQVALTVNLHTPGKGWWAQNLALTVGNGSGEVLAPAPAAQGPMPRLSVLTPQPGEAVSTSNRQYVISGTATDPAQSPGQIGIDWVELWMNGEANTQGATILGVAEVNASGAWSLTFDPAQFEPTDANLYAYAHSAVTGKRTEVVVHFQITNRR